MTRATTILAFAIVYESPGETRRNGNITGHPQMARASTPRPFTLKAP